MLRSSTDNTQALGCYTEHPYLGHCSLVPVPLQFNFLSSFLCFWLEACLYSAIPLFRHSAIPLFFLAPVTFTTFFIRLALVFMVLKMLV